MTTPDPHRAALGRFARKLSAVLMLRGAVRWVTVWFFIWGVAVLAVRITGEVQQDWLLAGVWVCLPLAALAMFREYRRLAAPAVLRATYDRWNRCGGLVMAAATADVSAWNDRLPDAASPGLRWRGGRPALLLAIAAGFLVTALALPDRIAAGGRLHQLEVGSLVQEIQAEVQGLKEEKVMEEQKAEDLEKQLARLKEESSAMDPNKTWEALDHIRESNRQTAEQAAEEALSKMNSLTEAETLAAALQEASEAGLSPEASTKAAQDLAGMLKSAQLESGLVKLNIPPELMSSLEGLSREDLEKLMKALSANKLALGSMMTNLSGLKLIDAKLLGQCNSLGQCKNPGALAEYLCLCTNGCEGLNAIVAAYCHTGQLSRGGPGADMSWKQESSEQGAKFKEEVLKPSDHLSDARIIGVSRAAPQLTEDDVAVESGALAGAQAGGGAAHAQVILPRHRQAVRRFFARDDQ
jgi:hypothetical protein